MKIAINGQEVEAQPLAEASPSGPQFYELAQTPENAQLFHDALAAIKAQNENSQTVDLNPVSSYEQSRNFITADGKTVFSVRPDGDVVSVASVPHLHRGRLIAQAARSAGGDRLDCYAEPYARSDGTAGYRLVDLYAAAGFQEAARVAINPEYDNTGGAAEFVSVMGTGLPAGFTPKLFSLHGYDDAVAYRDAAMRRAGTREAEYWKQRHLGIKAGLLEDCEEFNKQLRQALSQAQAALDEQVKGFYDKYAAADGTISRQQAEQMLTGRELSGWRHTLAEWERMAKQGGHERAMSLEYYKSRISRLKQLQGQLTHVMNGVAAQGSGQLGHFLSSEYEDSYYRTVFTVQQGKNVFSANFSQLDPEGVKQAVRDQWRGSDYETRLYGSLVQRLPERLTQTLSSGIIQGRPYQAMASDLHSVFNGMAYSDVRRLVYTEAAHASELANRQAYRQEGVEQYEFMAALESNTCEECGELDGQTFDEEDAVEGENYPLIHPYCRCTTAPVITFDTDEDDGLADDSDGSNLDNTGVLSNSADDSRTTTDKTPVLSDKPTRWARDPATGKGVSIRDMTYQQWRQAVDSQRYKEHIDDSVGRSLTEESVEGATSLFNVTGSDTVKKVKHVPGSFENNANEEARFPIPQGTYLNIAEVFAGNVLSEAGHSVEAFALGSAKGVKNPDFWLDGKTAELKTLYGNGKNTVRNALKNAGRQSKTVVIDATNTSLLLAEVIDQCARRLTQPGGTIEKIIVLKGNRVEKTLTRGILEGEGAAHGL